MFRFYTSIIIIIAWVNELCNLYIYFCKKTRGNKM